MKKYKFFRRQKNRITLLKKKVYPIPQNLGQYNIIASDQKTTQNSSIPDIAIIFKSEFDYISRCILDYKDVETGGQLFGYWTAENIPVVLYAIGPGPKANHQATFFNQDIDYLKKIGRSLIDHFGLQHIGEWHSHHQLGLAQPSSHDADTMTSTVNEKHLRHFLLCIGNCTAYDSTLSAFNFVEGKRDYTKAYWCVRDIESPFRKLIDNELAPFLLHPKCEHASHGYIHSLKIASASVEPKYRESYWFSKKENRLEVKRIIDYIGKLPQPGRCVVQLDSNNFVTMTISYSEHVDQVFFPEIFPRTPPEITRIHRDQSIQSFYYPWNPRGYIYEDFIHYYNQTMEEL